MNKSLFEYEFLVKEVFYRGCHILTWLEKHPKIEALEKQAICATIMDALVYKELINPEKEFLNLDQLCITHNSADYHFEENPVICSIPQWSKEEFRKKSLVASCSVPASIFLSKPSSNVLHYNINDYNTVVSAFFLNFSFLIADYNSPTRLGQKAVDRPFLGVKINGVSYLVDVLTKRIFRADKFTELFDLHVKSIDYKENFGDEKAKYYNEKVREKLDLTTYLGINLPLVKSLEDVDDFAEMVYEIEKSKEYYPEEWEKYEELETKRLTLSF